jgi:putative salt-induced outer membrane protein
MPALLSIAGPAFSQTDDAPLVDGAEPTNAAENILPDPISKMLEAAFTSGNEAEIATVAKYAKEVAPEAAEEIDQRVAAKAEERQLAALEEQKNPNVFALWKGHIELGGFSSTGSTSELGVSLGFNAERRGLSWRHALRANVDYRRANGKTSRERIEAAYGPRYNFNPRGFVYGLAQYERDPGVGYDARYTGSVGVGYQIVQGDLTNLAIDVGPSLRHVAYIDGTTETKPGARFSLDGNWSLSSNLSLHQSASAYAEKHVASMSSLTALDTKLISVLTARLSYNILYETNSRLTSKKLDTLSKLTLIYDF